jgi:hypothetical protein
MKPNRDALQSIRIVEMMMSTRSRELHLRTTSYQIPWATDKWRTVLRPAMTHHHRDWRQEQHARKVAALASDQPCVLVWPVSDRVARGLESQLSALGGTVLTPVECPKWFRAVS